MGRPRTQASSGENDAPRNILIVNDEKIVFLFLQGCLEQAGYRAVTAGDGGSAMRAIEETSFDAVLLDCRLPDGDGLNVLRKIQAHDQDLPVIIITSHPSVENAVASMMAGATDYLGKPFSGKDILVRLERVLEMSRLRREVTRLKDEQLRCFGMVKVVGRSSDESQVADLSTLSRFKLPPEGINLEALERHLLVEALKRRSWNECEAGLLLGLNRDQVRDLMLKFGIRVPEQGKKEEEKGKDTDQGRERGVEGRGKRETLDVEDLFGSQVADRGAGLLPGINSDEALSEYDRLSLGVDVGTSHCKVVAYAKKADEYDEEKSHYSQSPLAIKCWSSIILFAKNNETSINYVRKFSDDYGIPKQEEYVNGEKIPFLFMDQVEQLLTQGKLNNEQYNILKRSTAVHYPLKTKTRNEDYADVERTVMRLNIEKILKPFVKEGLALDIAFAKPCEAGANYNSILMDAAAKVVNRNQTNDNRFIIRSEAVFSGHYLLNMLGVEDNDIAVCDIGAGTGDVYIFDQDGSKTKVMKTFMLGLQRLYSQALAGKLNSESPTRCTVLLAELGDQAGPAGGGPQAGAVVAVESDGTGQGTVLVAGAQAVAVLAAGEVGHLEVVVPATAAGALPSACPSASFAARSWCSEAPLSPIYAGREPAGSRVFR